MHCSLRGVASDTAARKIDQILQQVRPNYHKQYSAFVAHFPVLILIRTLLAMAYYEQVGLELYADKRVFSYDEVTA